ncbi:uncharacterized protein METZ01_LOCUS392239, partial [marine metagenome]
MNSLPSPEKKAVMVQRMFDQIAPTYDRLNRIITFGLDQSWRKRLLKELKIGEKRRILDLACGTGDFAKTSSEYGHDIIGIDFSLNMLRYAQKREIKNT